MSRIGGRTVAGALTVLAGLGAWVIGKKVGEKVAKATAGPPPPPPRLDDPPEPSTDAVEVPGR